MHPAISQDKCPAWGHHLHHTHPYRCCPLSSTQEKKELGGKGGDSEVSAYRIEPQGVVGQRGGDSGQDGSGHHCPQALGKDVHQRLEDADLAAQQEAQGHRRVQVGTADVAHALRHGRDG